jgi:ubiquinone/menaquinone biosynthesis C-methylase UbiE
MSSVLTLDDIRSYWTTQAIKGGKGPEVSWSDRHVIDMEIKEIAAHLSDGDRVLDIGCANGYSTLIWAAQRKLSIRALDYIPEMIRQARQRLAAHPRSLESSVEFAVGDITRLNEADATYDKVVVVRVIINLGNWEHQVTAVRECARVLKPGGLLLLSEATIQGWNNLNALRQEWGLEPIGMPAFNSYLDHDQLAEAVSADLQLLGIKNFASTYFVGTRVLKPLLIQATGAPVDAANPLTEFNRFFSQLPAAGDYGTQKLLIFRKSGAADVGSAHSLR